MASRRIFLQTAITGVAGSMLSSLSSPAAGISVAASAGKQPDLRLGMAGYTFVNFDLNASIAMMKRLNITEVSLKDFHLPLNSSPEKIRSVLDQLSAANIKVYTVGVIYMKTKEAVDQAFAYVKNVGVPMFVGVPTYELLDYTEQQVKATGIRIAIHNHGPEDKLYPAPADVYGHIKNRDARMGLCLDIGHAQRAGADPAQAVKTYHQRIFDMHLKDVTAVGKEGKATEIGRGIIDFPALVKALRKVQYKGCCSFEYGNDMKDPLPGIAESLGYFKGILTGVK